MTVPNAWWSAAGPTQGEDRDRTTVLERSHHGYILHRYSSNALAAHHKAIEHQSASPPMTMTAMKTNLCCARRASHDYDYSISCISLKSSAGAPLSSPCFMYSSTLIPGVAHSSKSLADRPESTPPLDESSTGSVAVS